jgi:hypothetical protein
MSVPMSITEIMEFSSVCYARPRALVIKNRSCGVRLKERSRIYELSQQVFQFAIIALLALSLETVFYSNLDPLRLPPTKTLLNLCKISRTVASVAPIVQCSTSSAEPK